MHYLCFFFFFWAPPRSLLCRSLLVVAAALIAFLSFLRVTRPGHRILWNFYETYDILLQISNLECVNIVSYHRELLHTMCINVEFMSIQMHFGQCRVVDKFPGGSECFVNKLQLNNIITHRVYIYEYVNYFHIDIKIQFILRHVYCTRKGHHQQDSDGNYPALLRNIKTY